MKHSTLLACCALSAFAAFAPAKAQDYAKPLAPVKPLTYLNPINPLSLCADPTAVEHEGRMYVYGTNDQQELDAVGVGTNNSYGHIKQLVCMSTADMVNWTHHGNIEMANVCGSWMGCSWAPSIVSRVEDDGLTHFYMYFSNGGGGVGVVTSTSPVGPWTDPLKRTFINGGTPGVWPCSWPFDPGVVIDDNGDGWLTLGGGDPVNGGTKLMPGNAMIVKLGKDMLSFDSEFVRIPAPYHMEASELNYIGGKWVYTYSTGWTDRNDWGQYSTTSPAPSTCSMCYLVSDNPLDADSWKWGGEVFKNPGNFGYPWGNNHTHLQKFGDNYYFIYHTQVMEKLAGIGGGYRSIAVNNATVDEEKVVLKAVNGSDTGIKQIKANVPNAFERQQAETMWNGVGFSILRYKPEGNTVIAKMQHGAWIGVRNVSFKEAAKTFTAKIKGNGRLEIRIDDLYSAPVGILEFSNTGVKDQTCNLTTEIKGSHTVYFVIAEASSTSRFDEWQFGTGDDAGVASVDGESPIVAREYFNAAGVKLHEPCQGICIERVTRADGTVSSSKIIER